MSVEKWGLFEVELKGPAEGNPFVDVQLSAEFKNGDTTIKAPGFYDGDGTYKIRFMPSVEGEWSYKTQSNSDALDGQMGRWADGQFRMRCTVGG